jgi:H+/Cl- antiporter ClcA
MPAGFALIAFISARYFPGTAGSGIPQTIAALNESGDRKKTNLLSLRIIVGKVMLTLGSLTVGASVGREGPTVQIGAAVMHLFYGRGPFRTAEQRRILILAGGAAGVAAAFNTPLGGIMFAIEELSKKHVFNANSPTLVTVIFAGLISLFLVGNYTYFGSTTVFLDWRAGTAAILICGIAGGAAGGIFSRLMISTTALAPSIVARYLRNRAFVFAALCGLAVAIIGIATDGIVFGTGYEVTRLTLEDRTPLPWHFSVTKMAATLLSTLSDIPGGIFAPCLAIGAGIGDNIAALLPDFAPHAAVVLLAMAAYLSGVTREPVTSFVIMMEMTDSHHMLLPLMTATLVASGVSRLICPAPLYQTLAERFLAGAGVQGNAGASAAQR